MLNIFAVLRSRNEYRRNFLILALIFIISLIFTACSSDGDIDMSSWTFTVFGGSPMSDVDFYDAFGTSPAAGPDFPKNLVFGTKSRAVMFAYLESDRPGDKKVDRPYTEINSSLEGAVNVYITSAQKQKILDKLASYEYVVIGIDQSKEEGPGKVGILAIFRQK